MLWLPAKLYELLVRLRIVAYETAYLKTQKLDAFVISVGNITLGGTGKTPFVNYIARYLTREDRAVAILTRGYGRQSKDRRVLNDSRQQMENLSTSSQQQTQIKNVESYTEVGDEPLMLARAMPDVPVIIDKNRYEAGIWAKQIFDSDVLILDDGYQHLQVARDLNILLLDATNPFGEFEMVPFGELREPLYALKRADVVIITRADRPFDQGQTLAIIKQVCGDEIPILYFYSTINRFRHLETNEIYEADAFVGWNIAVMCGIGNPQAFSDDLMAGGLNVVAENFFADHHAYTQKDLQTVIAAARAAGADGIFTTEKDAVRLEGLQFDRTMPIYAAQLELQGDDEVRLKSLLLRALIQKRA
ncbi:MAG: tetraacyldisaccharide 4'-kinase [Acidobacteriota bacterium]